MLAYLRQRRILAEVAIGRRGVDTQWRRRWATPAPYLTAVLGESPEEPTTPSPGGRPRCASRPTATPSSDRTPLRGLVVDEPGLLAPSGRDPRITSAPWIETTWAWWRRLNLHLSWNRRGWTWGCRTGLAGGPRDQGHASETGSSWDRQGPLRGSADAPLLAGASPLP